jgi:PAS domain S-box-containing protein
MPKITDKSEGQKAAEADVESFRHELGPFVVAAEETRMAMVFTDAKEPGHPIIFANDAFLALTGYARDEVLGQDFNFLMERGADTAALGKIVSEFKGHSEGGAEIQYRRKDGSAFWAALFISPVRDEDEKIVQYFASFVDLTRHKEEQIESKMLIDELNHRVKNTLATVQSIVWQASRTNSDPKLIREAIETRLFALSRSHDLLTREKAQGWRTCSTTPSSRSGSRTAARNASRSKARTSAFRPKPPWRLESRSTNLRPMPLNTARFPTQRDPSISSGRSSRERMAPD